MPLSYFKGWNGIIMFIKKYYLEKQKYILYLNIKRSVGTAGERWKIVFVNVSRKRSTSSNCPQGQWSVGTHVPPWEIKIHHFLKRVSWDPRWDTKNYHFIKRISWDHPWDYQTRIDWVTEAQSETLRTPQNVSAETVSLRAPLSCLVGLAGRRLSLA